MTAIATALGSSIVTNQMIMVTTALDRTARIWNADTGELLRIHECEDGLTCVSLLAINGDILIVAGSVDRIVRIWSINIGNLVARLEHHTCNILSISTHFSTIFGGLAVSTSEAPEKSAVVWSLDTLNVRNVFAGKDGHVNDVRSAQIFESPSTASAGASCEDTLVVTCGDRSIRLWSMKGDCLLRHITPIVGVLPIVYKVKVVFGATQQPLIISMSQDDFVRVWGLDGTFLTSFEETSRKGGAKGKETMRPFDIFEHTDDKREVSVLMAGPRGIAVSGDVTISFERAHC